MIRRAGMLALLALAACSRRDPEPTPAKIQPPDATVRAAPALVPPGGQLGERFLLGLAVYAVRSPRHDPRALVQRALGDSDLRLVDAPPKTPSPQPVIAVLRPSASEHGVPDKGTLQYFANGLSDRQKAEVLRTTSVTLLVVAGPATAALPAYRKALQLAEELAKDQDGFLWDEETRELFTRDAWKKRLEDWSAGIPPIDRHMTIHAYRHHDEGLMRLVTLGMAKLGLPDLAVNNVAAGDTRAMSNALNVLAQHLLEGRAVGTGGAFTLALAEIRHPGLRKRLQEDSKKNARGMGAVLLEQAKPEEGDPRNRLVNVIVRETTASEQEGHARLLDELFGSEDKATGVRHDEALLAASARARKKLLAMRERYSPKLPQLEQLLVKGPFAIPSGGNEWMWIEVVRWKGTTLEGILQNDAFDIPGLRAGTRVSVEEASVFDYIQIHADGTREGNETAKLLDAQGGPERTK